MRMPYDGAYRITQRYGSNYAAYARFNLKGHNGLDIGLPNKTPLLAVRRGVYRRYSDPTGYGVNGVLTDEEGTEWLYGHMASHSAPDGSLVDEGARLGLSDNTGNSTGPHLHFARRPKDADRNNGYGGWVNPRPYLPLRYRVALQTGHAPDGGGAPGEAEWTPRLASGLKARLEAAGVEAVISPGFYSAAGSPPAHLGTDFDLYVSLHYDARFPDTYTTGCCIARGIYETEYWEADRFIARWRAVYPEGTGIPLVMSRVNANMTQYYAWRHLTYVTPGVLIEHGVGAPGSGGDAPLLWDRLDRVADLDARALLDYLGVAAAPVPDPGDEELPMDTTPEERAEYKPYFESLGIPVNMETALMKRAALAKKRQEERGPAITGEYHTANREGKVVIRQKFSAGVLDYHEDTGNTYWGEMMVYPEDAR